MSTKRRQIDMVNAPTISFLPKSLELVFGRSLRTNALSMDHVTQTVTDMLLSSPRSCLEKATQDILPDVVRWFAAKANREREKPDMSVPTEYLEARFLAGIFESAKIGNVELIKAWFSYLPETADLATAKIFEVAVREGHIHLLQWLFDEDKLHNEEMISSVLNTHSNVVEWLRERFPNIMLSISFDKLVERWTGPDALGFMKNVWSE